MFDGSSSSRELTNAPGVVGARPALFLSRYGSRTSLVGQTCPPETFRPPPTA